MERKIDPQPEKLAIFCPTDRWDQIGEVLLDPALKPFHIRRTLVAGENGQAIDGVNIHVNGITDQLKDLFREKVGWEPVIYPVTDHLAD